MGLLRRHIGDLIVLKSFRSKLLFLSLRNHKRNLCTYRSLLGFTSLALGAMS
jgi:hypothetical protein